MRIVVVMVSVGVADGVVGQWRQATTMRTVSLVGERMDCLVEAFGGK